MLLHDSVQLLWPQLLTPSLEMNDAYGVMAWQSCATTAEPPILWSGGVRDLTYDCCHRYYGSVLILHMDSNTTVSCFKMIC